MTHVWIVEIDFSDGRGYVPTVGVALNRMDGRKKLTDWKDRMPQEKLRLKKYTSPCLHIWKDKP